MSGSLKLGIILVVGVIVLGMAINMLWALISKVIALLLPLAFVAGLGLILYSILSRKALGGGRRYLP